MVVALLVWQVFDARDWKFSPAALLGMGVESLLLAVALIGLSRVVDLGFAEARGCSGRAAGRGRPTCPPVGPLIGFLGTGVYEEALFRLALIPLIFGLLRLIQTPIVLANTLTITATAFLFSVAHHAGTPGESFTWFAFIFRWLAGIYFAWVFIARGFGIAVGTHSAYDILVGWLGWHF